MTSMPYSSTQLRFLCPNSPRISRDLRKHLFRLRIWRPLCHRSSTPLLDLSPQATSPSLDLSDYILDNLLDPSLIQSQYESDHEATSTCSNASNGTSVHSDNLLDPPLIQSQYESESTSTSTCSNASNIQPLGLHVALWNARSITKKFAYVHQQLLERRIDVLVLVETWHHTSEDVPIRRAIPPGYSLMDRPRPQCEDGTGRGGGVAVLFRSTLRSSIVKLDVLPTTFEAMCLSFATPRGSTTILSIYRPPPVKDKTENTVKFFEEFSAVLESLITRNSRILIVGDFNLPLVNASHPFSTRFLDLLAQFGLRQHVTSPTHKRGGILDLVITEDSLDVLALTVTPPSISDHAFIDFSIPSLHTQPIYALRHVRGWRSLDYAAFREALSSSPLCADPSAYDQLTTSQLFDLYETTVTEILDRILPSRRIASRYRPLAVWFDRDCRQSRRRVRYLERRYRRTLLPADRLEWITRLRSLHSLYRQKEASYWEKLVSSNSNNPKRLWSAVSGLLGGSNRSMAQQSFTADEFLRSFQSKLETLRSSTANAPPPTFSITHSSFDAFRPVTEMELRQVIASSKLTSCELDPLPAFIIVNILDDIVLFLVYLFNRSLFDCSVPVSQKRALVFPSLKHPALDPNLPTNYRPISNLSFLSKTLERLVTAQLVPYLEQAGLLPARQSGFRTNHSTETLLLSLLSDIYTAIDHSHLALLALFDVSAAFDTVDHGILLRRLEISCGISGLPLSWFRSYLSDRSQLVVLGDSRSRWVPVFYGVPQGSVLGPLLYLLYTADITRIFSKQAVTGHLYADDTQAFTTGPANSQLSLIGKINSLTLELHLWMSANRLCLNPSKTQLIWFGSKHLLQTVDYALLARLYPSLSFSHVVRNLGVHLDSALTFSHHFSLLTRSCYFHLRRLRVIRRSVSCDVLQTLIHAFVTNRIDYCSSIYIGLPQYRLASLQAVLNSAARLIARLPRFSPISDFLSNHLHWLPISLRIRLRVLIHVCRAFSNRSPGYISGLLLRPQSASSLRPLRSLARCDLSVPRARTEMAKDRAFAIAGPSLWNGLPPPLRSSLLSASLPVAVRSLKTYLFPSTP